MAATRPLTDSEKALVEAGLGYLERMLAPGRSEHLPGLVLLALAEAGLDPTRAPDRKRCLDRLDRLKHALLADDVRIPIRDTRVTRRA